jgi:hypothetical protein
VDKQKKKRILFYIYITGKTQQKIQPTGMFVITQPKTTDVYFSTAGCREAELKWLFISKFSVARVLLKPFLQLS